MNQFLLFGGDHYYPGGGWIDFIDSFTTLEEAVTKAKELDRNWWHVIDSTNGEEVA